MTDEINKSPELSYKVNKSRQLLHEIATDILLDIHEYGAFPNHMSFSAQQLQNYCNNLNTELWAFIELAKKGIENEDSNFRPSKAIAYLFVKLISDINNQIFGILFDSCDIVIGDEDKITINRKIIFYFMMRYISSRLEIKYKVIDEQKTSQEFWENIGKILTKHYKEYSMKQEIDSLFFDVLDDFEIIYEITKLKLDIDITNNSILKKINF